MESKEKGLQDRGKSSPFIWHGDVTKRQEAELEMKMLRCSLGVTTGLKMITLAAQSGSLADTVRGSS